jgi:hypothetical protein
LKNPTRKKPNETSGGAALFSRITYIDRFDPETLVEGVLILLLQARGSVSLMGVKKTPWFSINRPKPTVAKNAQPDLNACSFHLSDYNQRN